VHSFVIRSFSRNRIRQNIAAYAACADPYSSEFGPEYLAFRVVNMAPLYLFKTETISYGLVNLPREQTTSGTTQQRSNKMTLIQRRSIVCRET